MTFFLCVKLNKSQEIGRKMYLHNLIKLKFLAVTALFRKKES